MKEINPSEKILDLLSTKKYTSLTEEEILLVLNEMDKEDYVLMFELQHQLNSSFRENTVSPNEKLKEKLMNVFDKHHSVKNSNKRMPGFLFVKIPLYQSIAAAFISLIFLSAVYFLNGFPSKTADRIIYKYLTDTLYVQPDIVIRHDTIFTTNSSISYKENSNQQKSNQQITKNLNPEKSISALCRSIKTDSSLKQFLVSL